MITERNLIDTIDELIDESLRSGAEIMTPTGLAEAAEKIASAIFGSGPPVGFDRTRVWRDKIGYIVTTEPYGRQAELEEWCDAQGWKWRLVPGGMWYPPHTVLYLVAPPKNGGNVFVAAYAYTKSVGGTPDSGG